MSVSIALFLVLSIGLFCADLWNHRKGSVVTLGSAVRWTCGYVLAALVFAWHLYMESPDQASLFLSGYALEKALAFDNLFVFSMIFAYFKISDKDQHHALHWGIAGAVVFRLIFVAIGASTLSYYGGAVEFIFAAVILFSVYLMMGSGDDEVDYSALWYVKCIKKIFPKVSVLAISIVVIELSDVMFSFDSVPAVIAVTQDPFLIYSAMIFAILGLRSMYFIIASMKNSLVYMDKAIVIVLLFISGKLFGSALFGLHLDPNTSLGIILSIICVGALASVSKEGEKCSG